MAAKLSAEIASTVHNHSVGGTFISNRWGGDNYYKRIDSMPSDLNFVVFQGAGNDYKQPNYALGQMGDTTNATYFGSVDMLINKLRTKYPAAKLICLSAPISTVNTPGQAYFDAMKAFMQVARHYNCPVVDVSVSIDPDAMFMANNMPDGAHLNYVGMDRYVSVMARVMRYLLQRS